MGPGSRQCDLRDYLHPNESLRTSSLDAFLNSFISKARVTSLIVFATLAFLIFLFGAVSDRNLGPKVRNLVTKLWLRKIGKESKEGKNKN